jgi:hypothetical protein
MLDGRENDADTLPSVLVHQLQLGIHENLGYREAAQFELRAHDVAVDDKLALHEGVLQGHGFDEGGRYPAQTGPALVQRIGVGHEYLGRRETQNSHKDDSDGDN